MPITLHPFNFASCPTTDPTAPDAAEITIVSFNFGLHNLLVILKSQKNEILDSMIENMKTCNSIKPKIEIKKLINGRYKLEKYSKNSVNIFFIPKNKI